MLPLSARRGLSRPTPCRRTAYATPANAPVRSRAAGLQCRGTATREGAAHGGGSAPHRLGRDHRGSDAAPVGLHPHRHVEPARAREGGLRLARRPPSQGGHRRRRGPEHGQPGATPEAGRASSARASAASVATVASSCGISASSSGASISSGVPAIEPSTAPSSSSCRRRRARSLRALCESLVRSNPSHPSVSSRTGPSRRSSR